MTEILIVIGSFAVFYGIDWLRINKNKKAALKYCKLNNIEFIASKSYKLYFRLYFKKGIYEDWADYKTDRNGEISWKGDSPVVKVQNARR